MATLFNTKIKDTYQSLLKLEDNTILTTTTKNVTDGLGNASPLYMSTTRIGIGTNSPTGVLHVVSTEVMGGNNGGQIVLSQSGANSAVVGIQGSGWNTFGIWGISRFTTTSVPDLRVFADGKVSASVSLLVGSITASTAKLTVRGDGSSSATTSFLVQNSSAQSALTILDDRTSAFGSNVSISPTSGGSILLGVDSNIMFRITDGSGYQKFSIARGLSGGALSLSGGSQGATSYNLSDSGHIFSFPSSNNNADTVTITRPFRGNINLSTINLLNITSTNEIALSNATLLRGLYINPTVTDWVSVRAIETTAGNVIFNGGNVGIGTSSPAYRLDVSGTGRFSDTITYNGNLTPLSTSSAYSVGLSSTSVGGRITAYTNSGASGMQYFNFGFNNTSLITDGGFTNTTHNGVGFAITSTLGYGGTGGGTYTTFLINPTLNFAGNPNPGTYRAIYYNPTLTNLTNATHVAIETVSGNVLFNTTSGNTLIGTTTNSGYKLDINGSTRVKGNSLTLSASGLSSPPANYVGLNFDENPNHHEYWYAINSKKDLYGAIGVGYDRIIFPTMGNDSSTWEFNALGSYSRIQVSARNNTAGNYLNLTNSSIVFCGPWTVASIDRTNRKLVFGNMTTDVHHIAVYDILIKGAQPFESNTGGSIANGGNVYVVGGTPSTSPAGNYGNVVLAHDGTSARGNVGVGEASPTARLQVKGSGSTSATTSLLVQNSAGTAALTVRDDLASVFGGQIIGVGSGTFLTNTGSTFSHSIIGGNSTLDYFNGFTIQNAGQQAIKSAYNGNTRFLRTCLFGADSTNDASSQVQIDSTTKGFLPPRGTNAQMLAIVSPAEGLVFYDLTNHKLNVFDGTSWVAMH